MKTLLLPYSVKKWGWLLLIPAFIGAIFLQLEWIPDFMNPSISIFGLFGDSIFSSKQDTAFRIGHLDLIRNLIGICFLIGGILVMFSKEKKEDEFINQLRLNALQFAVLINYSLLFLCFLFIHGFAFLDVMMYNMFTVIIIYILRFRFLLFNHSTNRNEE